MDFKTNHWILFIYVTYKSNKYQDFVLRILGFSVMCLAALAVFILSDMKPTLSLGFIFLLHPDPLPKEWVFLSL